MTAVSHHGISLKYASNELKQNFDIVKTAVMNHGSALEFADKNLKKN